MTTELTKAAQQALEVLESLQGGCTDHDDGTVEAITVWCPEVIEALRNALTQRPAAQTEQQPVASAPVADERVAKLDAECNSLAHQLNASNERNGMLRAALSDCSAELFAQCGDQSRAMSYVNAARAALAQNATQQATPERHLIVTTNQQGDAVIVSWQDDEHRILEVIWERATPPQQAAGEPVGEVVRDTLGRNGRPWLGVTWAPGIDLPDGAKLFTHPAPGMPEGWTDADADAARLAMELECLLLDTKDTAAVSRWWKSANEALDLHRARLAAAQAKGADQ